VICKYSNCTGLTSIIIPTSVKSIEEYTFGRCSSLTAIEIPSSVKRIKWNAFWEGKLKELHIRNEHPEQMDVDEGAFGEMAENCTLYVPVGTGYAYRHHPVFGKFKEVIIERIKEKLKKSS